ncbi:hypothetical protein EDF56_1045 [Novosphingobium sp. PhB165]|nr:hypothetical protein EDF56_1045 [Novosphingobium sp. PhB165]
MVPDDKDHRIVASALETAGIVKQAIVKVYKRSCHGLTQVAADRFNAHLLDSIRTPNPGDPVAAMIAGLLPKRSNGMTSKTYLVTGASDGIGALYADRLARRGHDLILVARRKDKLADLAGRLEAETGVSVEVIGADLANAGDLLHVEQRLRDDAAIVGLINNAGIANEGTILEADPDYLSAMIDLNIRAVTRLSAAIAPRLAAAGEGTIVNVTSVTALMPEAFTAVYPATKAYVLALSEALAAELGPKGVRVQAVLPGITRTPIWTEEKMAALPAHMVMEAEDMVDAALAGLDMGEAVTIPALPDMAQYEAYIAARTALRPGLSLAKPAARYGAVMAS